MWRHGYDNPVNVNDNEVYCGGYGEHWGKNQGRCGVCGDDVGLTAPRPHETGGVFGNKIVAETYEEGDIIDVEVVITANHWGFFEMKLCPLDEESDWRNETQECFDSHPLEIIKEVSEPGSRRADPGAGGQSALIVTSIECVSWSSVVDSVWCKENCLLDVYNCPQDLCYCTVDIIGDAVPIQSPSVTPSPLDQSLSQLQCHGTPEYQFVPHINKLCTVSCNHQESFCPGDVCVCDHDDDVVYSPASTISPPTSTQSLFCGFFLDCSTNETTTSPTTSTSTTTTTTATTTTTTTAYKTDDSTDSYDVSDNYEEYNEDDFFYHKCFDEVSTTPTSFL